MEKKSNINSRYPVSKKEEEIKSSLMFNDNVKEINKNLKFKDGSKPIHYASLYDNIHFFNRGDVTLCDLKEVGGNYKSSPLIYACYNSSYKVIFFMLNNDVDIFYTNSVKINALKVVIKNDDVFAFIIFMLYFERKLEERYINLIFKKKVKKIIRFLEIHHESIYNLSFVRKKKNGGYDKNLYLELISISLFYFFHNFFYIKVILCILTITFYLRVVKTRVLFYVNIYYKIKLFNYLKIIKYPILYFLFILQVLFFVKLTLPVEKNKTKKFTECRKEIINLIFEDKYDKEMFCYSCLNVKENNTKHCSICNGCIKNHDHHCPFLKNCITSRNQSTFSFYICISIFLYSSVIYYIIDIEFQIIALLLLLTCINTINKIQQDHRNHQSS